MNSPNDLPPLPPPPEQRQRPALPPAPNPPTEAWGRPDPPEAFGVAHHARPKKAPPEDEEKSDQQNDTQSEDADDQEKETPKKPLYKRPAFLITAAIILLAAIIVGIAFYIHHRHWQSTDDAQTDGHYVEISSKVSGRVEKVLITDNQDVVAGQKLIELDPRDYQAQRAQSEAALGVAQAEAARANAELARYQHVASTGPNAVSPQDLDEVVAAARKANAQVVQAQADLNAADLNLSYTTIVAPFSGRIARKQIEPGAYVTPGQTMCSLVDPHVWVTANFKETQLTYMHPGDQVLITIDAYPGLKLHGHVDSLQPGSGAVFSLLPAENATGNFVKVVQRVPVKIVFDDYDPTRQPFLGVGLSVTPKVRIR
ncbi:MAG TPA: HlyD family secretion protein [Phycisphaerae bacterium]|nr:HlyD family secretion protein [Phycisphaerae bacterium]